MVTPIREEWGADLQDLVDQASRGEITHAVICYRTKDGDIKYRAFGEEHGTYLIGLLARTAIHFHTQSTE